MGGVPSPSMRCLVHVATVCPRAAGSLSTRTGDRSPTGQNPLFNAPNTSLQDIFKTIHAKRVQILCAIPRTMTNARCNQATLFIV
eukprot:5051010-Amphidinium_carterae.2